MPNYLLPIIAGVLLLDHAQRSAEVPPVHYVDNIPGSLNGCCIPPFGIYIQKQHMGNIRLLRHELEHWQQYREMGLLRFYSTYNDELAQYGYDLAPMEIQARIAAGEDPAAIFNYTEAVRSGQALTVYNPFFRS